MTDYAPVTAEGDTVTMDTDAAYYLFTYNCETLCSGGQYGFSDLGDAIYSYLILTARRDGYSDAAVKVAYNDGNNTLTITLSGTTDTYVQNLAKFLNIGLTGLSAAWTVQEAGGIWNTETWSFFLTWSMAFQNQKCVQILHFPPDTVPAGTHDDLLAATTIRWGQMLEVNGAEIGSSTWYQSIDDILPIAAPADAGNSMDAAIPYFSDYSAQLLEFKCLPQSDDIKLPRPITVFGGPARDWFAKNYLDGADFGPLTLAPVTIGGVSGIPALAANHPSDIYYQEPKGGQEAMNVMFEDLVAAYWEVQMCNAVADGTVTSVDEMMDYAKKVLSDAYTEWKTTRASEICQIYYVTTWTMWPDDADQQKCTAPTVEEP